MANLRIRLQINKGRRGVPLDKLERVIHEARRFLEDIASDLEVPQPSEWGGIDFRNGSLSYTAQNTSPVSPAVFRRFNEGVSNLSRNRLPEYLKPSTAAQFHELVQPLESDEVMRVGLFPETGKRLKWLSISKGTLSLPVNVMLTERESVGSVQGVIHSLFKESREPFFQLRDLFSGALVKCLYREDDYAAVIEAIRIPHRVVHVHGLIREVSGDQRHISSVDVDRILLPDPFTFADVESFLNGGTVQ